MKTRFRIESPALTPNAFLLLALAGLTLVAAFPALSNAKTLNGFEIGNLSVTRKYVRSGGPPRDGIPSIDNPRFLPSEAAEFVADSDRVLGVQIDGRAKAYPVKILDRHEIVNDRLNGRAIVVTYCPLCGSGIAFDADINGRKTFGVSGLLYNSDVLLYDRQTESLWSQIDMEAVAGPLQGTELEPVVTRVTSWEAWKEQHPETLVLSNRQGIYPPAAYEQKAYQGYEQSKRIWFPVENKSSRLHPKDWVTGLEADGQYKAYPRKALAKTNPPIVDTFADREFVITFDDKANEVTIRDQKGELVPVVDLYWFAWYAFHPKTEVYE